MKNPKVSIIAIYGKHDLLNDFIQSLINQTFNNIEIIFVNAGADEKAYDLISDAKKIDERIQLINLPDNNNIETAKQSGFNVASGDYVCFLNANQPVKLDYIRELYYDSVYSNNNIISVKDGLIYKREFLENNLNIDEIIQNKLNIELEKIKELIKQETDKNSKNAENIISNKVYESNKRADYLEKLLFDKINEIKSEAYGITQKISSEREENNRHIYEDISKIYDYINSEINKKGCEINNLYDEISKNYRYTEKLNEESNQNCYNEIDLIYKKIESLYKEQEIRYNNLQRQIELVSDMLGNKINALSMLSDSNVLSDSEKLSDILDLKKSVKDNFNKIYSYIDENNSKFYGELSNLYKEISDKINN